MVTYTLYVHKISIRGEGGICKQQQIYLRIFLEKKIWFLEFLAYNLDILYTQKLNISVCSRKHGQVYVFTASAHWADSVSKVTISFSRVCASVSVPLQKTHFLETSGRRAYCLYWHTSRWFLDFFLFQ